MPSSSSGSSSVRESKESFYESSVRKFGIDIVCDALPSTEEWNLMVSSPSHSKHMENLPLCMVVASLSKKGDYMVLALVYALLRRDVNEFVEIVIMKGMKRSMKGSGSPLLAASSHGRPEKRFKLGF